MFRPYEPMNGHFVVEGRHIASAGFMPSGLGPVGPQGFSLSPSVPCFTRGTNLSEAATEFIQGLERVEVTGDFSQIAHNLSMTLSELQRGITSGMTAFPSRENLEAEAKLLVPTDTPIRNMLARTPGAGKATQWRQITSLGGGYGTSLDQPGGVSSRQMFFGESGSPDRTGNTVYANVSKDYKLLGTWGQVTGFAMAAGANFQNQYAVEKANTVRNLMLNEENALINGDSTSTAAPWGDGTNALAFDGLIKLFDTGNGMPAAQQVATVGPLTLSHIDNQLRRLWNQGAQNPWILMNGIEVLSLVHLAQAAGSIIRVNATAQADTILGVAVTGYKHPITGEIVPIIVDRFQPQGTILFGSKFLPDGTPTLDVNVLPQVQLPELAPNENLQGYVAQEVAPTAAAPQVYGFLVSVYEVLRLKSANHVAKSTGVTAV